jgi:hypothetical protein
MLTPHLEWTGHVRVPFQGVFFLGHGSPMALPWADSELPLTGRQTQTPLSPRRSTPFAAHGNAVGKQARIKYEALEGHPNLPDPFQRGPHHGAPFQGLAFVTDRTHGVAVGCE